MADLNDKDEAFYEYFIKQYVPHMDEWVTCHRVGTIVQKMEKGKMTHSNLR